MICVHIIDCME